MTTWRDDAPMDEVRFVVLDLETTGLECAQQSHRHHRRGRRARRRDSCSATLLGAAESDQNTPAVTVHGVTREQSRTGVDEPRRWNGSWTTCATA